VNYKPLLKREEFIASKIVSLAYTVHKKLGPNLLLKELLS
jgi:hypothetical protein